MLMDQPAQPNPSDLNDVRDPHAAPGAVAEARSRSMSERLELALSWNALAADLRVGLAEVTGVQRMKS
jgi:hypothetical protein